MALEAQSTHEHLESFEEGGSVDTNERLLAGLSYVSQIILPALLPVILLLSPETRTKPFLRYHAVQSLAILALAIVYFLAATAVYILGSATESCLACVLWVLFFVPAGVLLYAGWGAFRGRYVRICWLTRFLEENRWL
ncbi:MAG: hypothetical protein H5T69_16885 [Chloroflexi bacterium]|nr:hypothetical protein [Chloroflexota bacterium]